MLDYSKKQNITFPFEAPANGVVYLTMQYANDSSHGYGGGDFYINDTFISSNYSSASWNGSKQTVTVMVSKKDIITFSGYYNQGNYSIFVPYK